MDKKIVMDEFCRILKKINALEFGTFRLPNGRITPYYVDLRIITSFPDAFHKLVNLCIGYVEENLGGGAFDRIAGIPIAGIPLASIIAYNLKKPFLYVRQGERLHGRERRVEGVLMPGDRVLLVDDLITTGRSLLRTAEAVRSEGGVVNDAFVLLDREEMGRARLAKNNIEVHALFRISEIAERLFEIDAITEEQLDIILKQTEKEKKAAGTATQ